VAILRARGIQHAVVAPVATVASSVITWTAVAVAIRHPDDPKKVVTRIPLSDSAMSTSETTNDISTRKACAITNIIDPRTGHSASKVRSATILAPTATQNRRHVEDRLRARPEKALEIINRMPEYDAVFVCPDGRVLYSNGCGRRCRDGRARRPPRATATSPRVTP